MAFLALSMVVLLAMADYSSAAYCVCNTALSDSVLQKNIDYACGAGADCSQILQSGPCFNPNTVKDHCNFAVNSYFQKKGQVQGSCDFLGTATVSQTPPSGANSACYAGNPSTSTPTNPTLAPPGTGTGTLPPGTGTGTGTPPPGTGTGTGTPPPGTGTGTGTPPPGTGTGTGTGTPPPGTGTGTGTPPPGTGTGTGTGTPPPGTGTGTPGTGTGTGTPGTGTGTGTGTPGTGTGTGTGIGTGTGTGTGTGINVNPPIGLAPGGTNGFNDNSGSVSIHQSTNLFTFTTLLVSGLIWLRLM